MDFKYDITELLKQPNICDTLSSDEREFIGNQCVDGYDRDKSSRSDWEERMANANKLALQAAGSKTDPWQDASNVMFPLVTTAALQWHARAYSLLMPGVDIAKCRVIGEDPDKKKYDRAQRVGAHLSYQLLEEDESWEEDQDKTLLVQAICGSAFKKTYFDPILRRIVSRLILPSDLVINYWTKGEINHAPRVSHYILFSENDVHERESTGRFCTYADKIYTKPAPRQDNPVQIAKDQREGLSPPGQDETTPCEYIEQLCWLDLDGDGYKEPYIATVELDTHVLRRLVARYVERTIIRTTDGKVAYIHPQKIYTKYGLIPSPDGGFYDLGFGLLMGPLNESANSIINQLIDAGTMYNYGGGFLGRGAKFRSGKYTFDPQEWKQMDFMGDDIRKAVLPNLAKEPSDVLLKLMQFLIQYAERIASSNEIQAGDNPGQNTPAETMRTMNENGQRVFAATFLRTWRSFRNELRIYYYLDTIHIREDRDFENLSTGAGAVIHPDDYSIGAPTDVRPAADPRVVSREIRVREAQSTMQLALQVPGFNKYKSIRRVLEALGTPAIDEIFPRPQTAPQQPGAQPPQGPQPEPDIQPPPNAKMLDVQLKMKQQQLDEADRKIQRKMDMMELQQAGQLIQGKVTELHAKAMKEVAEAKAAGREADLKAIELEIRMQEARSEGYFRAMEILQKEFENDAKRSDSNSTGSGDSGLAAASGNQGAPGAPAPSTQGHAMGLG